MSEPLVDAPVLPNVVLVGMMGTGKSSVGRLIAENLGWRLIDTDQLVIQEAGLSIPQIFETEGEAGFRLRESRALESLRHCQGAVISTGGGTVVTPTNRVLLKELGFVIWLKASVDVLMQRVSMNRDRPLLIEGNPRKRLIELLDARRDLYASVADLTVDTTDLTLEETVHGVVESVQYHFACRQ